MPFIPCQWCHQGFMDTWRWLICNRCGFRICSTSIAKHQGTYGTGYKCSQCALGHMGG